MIRNAQGFPENVRVSEEKTYVYPHNLVEFMHSLIDDGSMQDALAAYHLAELAMEYENGDLGGHEFAEYMNDANFFGLTWKFEPYCYSEQRYWDKFIVLGYAGNHVPTMPF